MKMLSGEELVIKGGLKRNSSLPTRGVKEVLSCGSYVEAHQVADTLRMKKELLQDERVEKWGILSQAEWIKEKQMALVTKPQGGHWSYIGHVEFGNKLYLYPEETLYLMEVNSLQLRYSGVLVSFQQAYTLLFEDAWAVQAYKVYASLCRKGYKLLRHSKPRLLDSDIKLDGKNIVGQEVQTLDSELGDCESEDWRAYPLLLMESESDIQESDEKSCEEYEINPKQLSIMWSDIVSENVDLTTDSSRPKTSLRNQEMEVECLDSDDDCEIIEPTSSRLNSNSSKKKTYYNTDTSRLKLDSIILPNLFGKKVASFEAPPSSLLPPNIHLNKKHYFFDLNNMHKGLLGIENDKLSDDTDSRIAIEERNFRSITAGDNVQKEMPQNINRLPQNTSYHRPNRHMPYTQTFRGSHFYARQSPSYQFNHLISNPFQAGYFQLNFRHQLTVGSQNPFFQQYGSRFRRQQHFSLRNTQTNASAGNSEANKTQYNYSHKTSIQKNEKPTQTKKQTKHLELIKQCAIQYQKILNKQASQNTASLLQSLLCTYNDKYNDFIFLNRRYEIEHAASENVSSDSDCTAAASDGTGKRRKRIKTKHQKRSKESNDVCYLSSSDEDCVPIPTESINKNKINRPENTEMSYKCCSAASAKNNKILAKFKGWISKDSSVLGRPAVNSNDRKRNQITETQKSKMYQQYLNCMSRNRFENWSAIKAAFERNLSDSVLFFSHDSKSDVASAIKYDKIKPLLRPEDCRSIRSVLNRVQIIKNGDSGDVTELKIYYDVYLPTEKCLKSSLPPPAFRVVCLNESEPVPDTASISVSWSCCGDQIPLVLAVVGRDAISFVQLGPVDIPTLTPQEQCY